MIRQQSLMLNVVHLVHAVHPVHLETVVQPAHPVELSQPVPMVHLVLVVPPVPSVHVVHLPRVYDCGRSELCAGMIIWMNVSSEFGFWKVSVTSFESFLYSPGCHHANIIVIQIIWNVFLLHRSFPKWRLKRTDLQYPISPALLCTCYYPLCVLLALEILCSSTKLTFALMLSECCVSLCLAVLHGELKLVSIQHTVSTNKFWPHAGTNLLE